MVNTIELAPYKANDPRDIGVMLCAADVIEKCRAVGKELVMPDGTPIDPNTWVVLTKGQLEALGLTWRDF